MIVCVAGTGPGQSQPDIVLNTKQPEQPSSQIQSQHQNPKANRGQAGREYRGPTGIQPGRFSRACRARRYIYSKARPDTARYRT